MPRVNVTRPVLFVFTGLAISTLAFAVIGLLWGLVVAKSVLIGCAVFSLPTIYFTYYAFRFDAERQTEQMVRSFFQGQSNKLVLMAVCFSLVFVFVKPLSMPALFIGFGLMIAVHLVIAGIVSKSLEASS